MNLIQEIGKSGEERAAEYLRSQDFMIRELNWRSGHLEVDIIAENNEVIIFCEVKTRTSVRMGQPENFVTFQKQRNLIRAAHYYLNNKRITKEVRFDIISILITKTEPVIHHIPGAFTPRW